MAFLTPYQLHQIGFKHLGKDVLVSDKASIYGAENISIGDHSRIDDFTILSAGKGGIDIGKYVHIACHCSLIGQGNITMEDYSGTSSRVAIYSSSDVYNGMWMTNPCVPESLRNTYHLSVYLGKHVVVGTGSTILPGVSLDHGCAVGAMSLVNTSFSSYTILYGIPAKAQKIRTQIFDKLEKLI